MSSDNTSSGRKKRFATKTELAQRAMRRTPASSLESAEIIYGARQKPVRNKRHKARVKTRTPTPPIPKPPALRPKTRSPRVNHMWGNMHGGDESDSSSSEAEEGLFPSIDLSGEVSESGDDLGWFFDDHSDTSSVDLNVIPKKRTAVTVSSIVLPSLYDDSSADEESSPVRKDPLYLPRSRRSRHTPTAERPKRKARPRRPVFFDDSSDDSSTDSTYSVRPASPKTAKLAGGLYGSGMAGRAGQRFKNKLFESSDRTKRAEALFDKMKANEKQTQSRFPPIKSAEKRAEHASMVSTVSGGVSSALSASVVLKPLSYVADGLAGGSKAVEAHSRVKASGEQRHFSQYHFDQVDRDVMTTKADIHKKRAVQNTAEAFSHAPVVGVVGSVAAKVAKRKVVPALEAHALAVSKSASVQRSKQSSKTLSPAPPLSDIRPKYMRPPRH